MNFTSLFTRTLWLTAIFLFTVVVILSCSSCKNDGVSQPAWESAYSRWQSLNIHNYTIDQKRTCFCYYGGANVRITVRDDTIALVVSILDSSIITYPFYRSIDSLFGMIRTSRADSLVIRYNSRYGYPEFLDIDPQLHPVDGGELYETSNLRIQ